MGRSFITPDLFQFYREIKRKNDRAWFEKNKARYHAVVRDPLLEFVSEMAPALEAISPYVVCDPRPVGGALFRIYRDTRFSKDKTPYKTHAGLHFRHARGRDAHAPGYYLHLAPDEVFFAAGIWHPDGPTARAIRQSIAEHPQRWKDTLADRRFKRHFRLTGDSATRMPRGFDPDHPCADDLRRKDWIASADLSEKEAARPDFPERLAELAAAGAPLMAFLTRALGVPW
jgi:uncharacterized protein (TIGR02453 family)